MSTNMTDRRLVTLVLVILGVLLLLPLFGMGFGMMGFMPFMGGMWGSGMWGGSTVPGWMLVVGLVMPLLFLVALVAVGYLVYRLLTDSDDADSAVEELRTAYARGDLTDEEYEERLDRLQRE